MFPKKLKELRESKNLSQYELAEIINVSRAAISKWEKGNGILSKCNLVSLCQCFDISEEELLSRNELLLEVEKSKKIKKTLYIIYLVLLYL